MAPQMSLTAKEGEEIRETLEVLAEISKIQQDQARTPSALMSGAIKLTTAFQ